MTTVKFKDWELSVDSEITKLTYDRIAVGGPETCGCYNCMNFANKREEIYPEEVKELLNQLGIDYTKESDVGHFYRQPDGLHLYNGWFHFKGYFKGRDCRVPDGNNGFTIDLTPVNDRFSIGFCYDTALTFFNEKQDLVQIEFIAKVPWTLNKELETE